MPAGDNRVTFSAHLRKDAKAKLQEIRRHHFSKGNDHMSMTRILETLIEREHKRLKLCSENPSTSPS